MIKDVITCNECKNYTKELLKGTAKVQAYCKRFFLTTPPEWYCADAERRADDKSGEDKTDG